MKLSPLVPVSQHFPNRGLPDVASAVAENIRASGIRPAGRVAVAVGSRGIANLSTIVRSAVMTLRGLGCQPFVIPAMGSHGGGTAEGQVHVLARYGITEAEIGCPIVSSLDVVPIGRTPEGIEVIIDRHAFESDGIFLINRVKWHTTFDAPIESGLMKMAAIGLGKLKGAQTYHRHIVRLGFADVIRSVGRTVLASGKVIGGLAIGEDAHHDTAKVIAAPAVRIEEVEEKLLALVKSWMPRILFDEIDILIVDEIGKHISGVGMDSKVVNRHPYGAPNPWPWAPRILRIYVRDVSPQSYGNANGLGMADMISDRLYEKIDWNATRVNALTASNLSSIRTPLRAATDLEALEILGAAVGRERSEDITCVWIRNTLELDRILVTKNLLNHVPTNVEVTGPAADWDFNSTGDHDFSKAGQCPAAAH